MTKLALVMCAVFALTCSLRADQPTVRLEPPNLQGPRVLNEQTKTAVIRDYLQAWQSVRAALQQNRADLLNRDFVGTAKDKLTDTIHDQVTMGISTRYLDQSHNLQIIFYSPEGLSIQLVDNVEYEVQVADHGKTLATQKMHARYVVVMTPAEVRWRVRVFQGGPE
ncbi:MAG TPA: hypothetical protein VK513_01850 [Terriglobales bacterium]|jgi:hypothetical protein|nr:hypothetical protein [Terriglobales bacterium]